ncbi:MAG: CinA family nicotinamide mononucleotide deamidase-related protein [Thermoanaerobaculales bacterium]
MSEARKTAACLAVGSELLGERRQDSNSLTVTRALARRGVVVTEKRVVGDSVDQTATAIRELLASHDLVVVTGGLGPTADDLTREAVAQALGRELRPDADVEAMIRSRFADLGREMPDICTTMARVVDGSRPLQNRRGSAPGLMVETDDRLLAVFPGVPWEMEEMLERDLLPEVARWNPGVAKVERTVLLGGVVESEVEERIHHLYERFGRENVTILASYGVVRLVLSAVGKEASARGQVDEMERTFCEVLGDDVAGVDIDGLPEAVLGELLREPATLAVAESCTGGLVGARITAVAGASAAFLGGVVCYSNEVKEALVGVSHDLLLEHGAVSEEVARAMATGVRERIGADWGAGITGIAGPAGGTEEKPVGLVHWAVAGPDGVSARHRVFPGDRAIIREWSSNAVLDLLRRRLIAESA